MPAKKKSDTPAAPAKFPARGRKKPAGTGAPAVAEAAAPVAEAVVTAAPTAAPAEAPPVVAVEPTPEAIRARAYAIWRAEGGNAQANWLRAEAELRGR
jgi:hypothetical protein